MIATASTTTQQKKLVTDIFSLIGHCEMVEDESFVDYNTTYCGCGVAYVSVNFDIAKLTRDEVFTDVYGSGGIF